jgi:hypothetical protein
MANKFLSFLKKVFRIKDGGRPSVVAGLEDSVVGCFVDVEAILGGTGVDGSIATNPEEEEVEEEEEDEEDEEDEEEDNMSYNSLYDWFPVEKSSEHLLLTDSAGRVYRVAHEDCQSLYGDHLSPRHSIKEVTDRLNFALGSDIKEKCGDFHITDGFELEFTGHLHKPQDGHLDDPLEEDLDEAQVDDVEGTDPKMKAAVEVPEYDLSCFNYYLTAEDVFPSEW